MGVSAKVKERNSLMPPHRLDQFYTKPAIVEQVLRLVDYNQYDLIIEPSAGAGDFLKRLPPDKSVGIDLEPATSGITKKNFFDFKPTETKNVLTIGNPPFGKNSSTAVKFFNHAAQFSDCIAFILPRTFRKPSIINRLNRHFHLVEQKLLPLQAFYTPSGQSYEVPTVFQVWKKKQIERGTIKTLSKHEDFDFVPIGKPVNEEQKKLQCDNSDFCVRRVGGAAGKIYKDYNIIYRDWKSHYYIKQNCRDVEYIMSNIKWDDNESPKYDTAGNPSISKHELITSYKETKEKYEHRNSKNHVQF
ncbi:MAG TPA: SAM-dependent methyltransferase [Balneola sp.]|nr:SAM-dependent methyltransferase [Balneola sp.]|tara:strand:+ start:474 stop:1379 length:906 start_codon:yes stop_codon:yes gene_type:complete